METLLKDIPRVTVITSDTEAEHLETIELVLNKLSTCGLRAKKEKCIFMASSVVYLGHLIDATGLHLERWRQSRKSKNVSELKAYLGLLTYYSRFLPNLSAPLYKLLSSKVKWEWTNKQAKAFNKSKKLLMSSKLLIHFDPESPITLACDASNYGIGAVLSHILPDVAMLQEHWTLPKRTTHSSKKKESRNFITICSVTSLTDHKPLLRLLGEDKPTASARVRRWSLYLSRFEFTMKFREHCNADALSQLPLPEESPVESSPPELVLLAEHLDNSPVNSKQIKAATAKDRKLSNTYRKGGQQTAPRMNLNHTFQEK